MRTLLVALVGAVLWAVPASAADLMITYSGTITQGYEADCCGGTIDLSGQAMTVGFEVDTSVSTLTPDGAMNGNGTTSPFALMLFGSDPEHLVGADNPNYGAFANNVYFGNSKTVAGFTTFVQWEGSADNFDASFGSPNNLTGWAITTSNDTMSGTLLPGDIPPIGVAMVADGHGQFELAITSFSIGTRVLAHGDLMSAAPEPGAWEILLVGFAAASYKFRRRQLMSPFAVGI